MLESVGVNASPSDSGLFHGTVDDALVLLEIFVDDLFIACDSFPVLERIKEKLASSFSMKDLGTLKHYLGMDIDYKREKGIVLLSQTNFITEVLKRFSMSQCKPTHTPMQTKTVLHPHNDGANTLTSNPHRQLIGSVMYLLLCTHPDISFPVSVLSKFLSSPTTEHWIFAKRILRYLRGTTDMELQFKSGKDLLII